MYLRTVSVSRCPVSATLRLCGLLLLTAYCFLPTAAQGPDYTRWVNPFIGTGGHGHTFPGATVPFGMVQLSPDTRIDNWDGSSGYHYSDNVIYGFSHTHLSGTGIPDGCDILLMPTVGELNLIDSQGRPSNGQRSTFSHAKERAAPGFYSVKLDNDVTAELTATARVGLHRYTFPKSERSHIVLDLSWRDQVLDSEIKYVSRRRFEGFRRSKSWAKDQTVYFVVEFSKPFKFYGMFDGGSDLRIDRGHSMQGTNLRSKFQFDTKAGEQILVKVAISYVSIEGARKNLEAEIPGWDFDKVRADARAAWNKELSKIEVSGGTDEQTTNFYTALYHTAIQPNIFSDVDGRYLGHDRKIHQLRSADTPVRMSVAKTRTSVKGSKRSARSRSLAASGDADKSVRGPSEQYTVFSLWDTFRAAHPLYTIIDEKRTVDFINTFIRIYEQGGRLPVWELWGEETDTMIGYHAVSVIADAMAKGIKGFDYEKAYAAAKHSAELNHFGLAAYKRRGYISSEDENESVSKTLEYAYDDYCIATMAQSLMREKIKSPAAYRNLTNEQLEKEATSYFERSLYYRNLFDPKTGFMRPKRNGGFLSPFAPNEVTFNYTEGNAWVYTFFAPHDVSGLAELYGGKIEFAKKLNELFTTSDKLTGRVQPDITGLIGQYAHGNEPSHHIPYLFNYANQPWQTAMYVRKIMDEFYHNAPDGLIGNEDCGQMSAWYILSALGFYQVAPSRPVYDIGSPLFKQAVIHLENGKKFTIKAPNNSVGDRYVRSVKLNGKPLREPFFRHSDITNGGTLEFEMAAEPVKDWFTSSSASEVGVSFTAVPVIEGERVFNGKTRINIKAPLGGKIYWRPGGTTDSHTWETEFHPFDISATTTITAFAVNERGKRSHEVSATFYKRPNDWSVKILSPYSTQYTGGGDDAIIDGLRGNANFASGEWQGYQGKTFEAVIDLKRETTIREVGGSFLQAAGSWIWMPDRLEFEFSNDGVNFVKLGDFKTGFPQDEMKGTVKEFTHAVKPVTARYVRVRAFNIGKIPAWHPGAGGDPWIFVDEIIIR